MSRQIVLEGPAIRRRAEEKIPDQVEAIDSKIVQCRKKPKDGKLQSRATNFLEVLLNDEATTEQQLNKLCGNENLFSYTRVPRRRAPVEVAPRGAMPIPEVVGEGVGASRDTSISYDMLLALDFLMKIRAVVDVERGLLQVRHCPGTNVEVLSLTVVNLLQRTNSGAPVQEPLTTWKNTHANGDSSWMPDQDQTIVTKGDDACTSDSNAGTDNSEYYDSESNQLKQIDCEDEFKDAEWRNW
ncbi:unnamed protein product [Sphagnum jensenii]|uniref:Uncharacterized protein n=1 Tax=Sphagnum jensenii TaxID=128206 RepID=A0ABP0XAQ6_9BRYO